MKQPGIYGFNKEYRFLSNFFPSKVIYDEMEYPTVEHAYQAAKTLNADLRKEIKSEKTSAGAKKLGQKIHLRENWEFIKNDIMEELVRQKFSKHENLKKLLLSTEDLYLEETNYWGDTHYGVCNGIGENHLGKILMKIRQELRNE